MLSTGNRGAITTRADALERYYRRYAKLDPESPTAGFIRALILLERNGFKPKSLGEEGERAKQLFLHGKEELEEYQVLPYPLLWEIILELIDNLKK